MLEDELVDIIGKAIRGQSNDSNAIQGINIDEIIAYKSEEKLRNLASRLNLNAEALISLDQEFTPPRLPKEVTQITSSFGHLGVNAFYIETSGYRVLIDTGTESKKVSHLNPDVIFITHEHPDHTSCLSNFNTPIITPRDPALLEEYECISYDVSGHYNPSLAYFFPHLSSPCCFVGDSIFRRSIGGCSNHFNYKLALNNITILLNALPKETILCVGHGPNTTVEEELIENPFFTKV